MSVMEGRMSEPELPDAAALSRVVAVINGKGGVLKTSIVANAVSYTHLTLPTKRIV